MFLIMYGMVTYRILGSLRKQKLSVLHGFFVTDFCLTLCNGLTSPEHRLGRLCITTYLLQTDAFCRMCYHVSFYFSCPTNLKGICRLRDFCMVNPYCPHTHFLLPAFFKMCYHTFSVCFLSRGSAWYKLLIFAGYTFKACVPFGSSFSFCSRQIAVDLWGGLCLNHGFMVLPFWLPGVGQMPWWSFVWVNHTVTTL